MGSCACKGRKNSLPLNSDLPLGDKNNQGTETTRGGNNFTNIPDLTSPTAVSQQQQNSVPNCIDPNAAAAAAAAAAASGIIKYFPLDSLPVETISLLRDSLIERDNLNSSVFPRLRSYCANKSCDLDIIDLHWHLENIDLINKYLHRNLIKCLLNDILVNSKCIFLIFLNESFDKPLCPDRIDKVDYVEIKKCLNQSECELLDSWYKMSTNTDCTSSSSSPPSDHYELKYFSNSNHMNLSEHLNMSRQEANKQLTKLLDLLQKAFNSNSNFNSLKQKYLKPIQEIEIDLAIQHLDSNLLIWFQRTAAIATPEEQHSIIKQLQLKVFQSNYKNYKVDTAATAASAVTSQNTTSLGHINDSYLNLLNQFIEEACIKLCDFHIQNFKEFETFLKLDRSLSYELCKHYEIYARHNSQFPDHHYTNLNDYFAKLNDYVDSNTLKGFILYDQVDSSHYDNDLLSKITAKWINNRLQKQQHSIIYRFCGHTIYSNNLYNLVQSILHQLCFLFEVHESFAFHDLNTLIKHLEKIFEYKYHQEQSTATKIIIILDRIDNVNNIYESEYSLNDENDKDKNEHLIQLLETIARLLNKYYKHFKLVITLANNKKSKLLQLLKSIFDNHNDYSFVQLTGIKEDHHRSSVYKQTNSRKLKQKIIEIYTTLAEYFIETPQIVACLFDYLINSRYGLKEIEILDLLYLSSLNLISIYKANNLTTTTNIANNSASTSSSKLTFNYTIYSLTSDISLNFIRSMTPIVWYTFKYYYFLQFKHKLHLFENFIHHNQLYYTFYDLNIKRKFHKYLYNNQNQSSTLNQQEFSLINKRLLILDYFNMKINQVYISKLNSNELASPQSPIRNPAATTTTSGSESRRNSVRKKSFSVLNELRLAVSIDDAQTRKLNDLPYQRVLFLHAIESGAAKKYPVVVNLLTYRMYQEVNLHYYNYYKHEYQLFSASMQQLQQQQQQQTTKKQQQQQQQTLTDQQLNFLVDYLKRYLINFDWFINKVKQTNIWFYLDDLEYYKFHLEQLAAHHNNTTTNMRFKNLYEEFILFEKCLFKILYALSNDINQIYVQLYQALHVFDVYQHLNTKFFIINDFFTKLKQYYESASMLYPLNMRIVVDNSAQQQQNQVLHKNRNIFTFNELISHNNPDKCIVTHVAFVKNLESYILTLSKNRNKIKIYNAQTLNVVRSIKLNKPPKDLRFIDSYRCVLLLDRNLHLFDLNKCEHLNDLKTTMDRNMPFFELHDENHIVFLDRHRLSVTLMKLPWKNNGNIDDDKQEPQSPEQQQQQSRIQKLKQFKAGEDRYMNSLMVSKNGKIMVCGDQTQKPFPLIVWNLFEQKLIHDFRQRNHEFITTIQSITTNGKYLICACREETDTRIFLLSYDLTSGRLYKKFETNSNFVCVEISEEYNAIVASLENNKILIYDITSENEKYVLQDSKYPVNKIKFTQFHRFLTYDTKGCDWTVRLWDLKQGLLLCSYTCPSLILSCDINSKSDTIALGLYNNSELYVLKLFPNLDTLTKYQLELEKSSSESSTTASATTTVAAVTTTNTEIPIYGDQSLIGKKCELSLRVLNGQRNEH